MTFKNILLHPEWLIYGTAFQTAYAVVNADSIDVFKSKLDKH